MCQAGSTGPVPSPSDAAGLSGTRIAQARRGAIIMENRLAAQNSVTPQLHLSAPALHVRTKAPVGPGSQRSGPGSPRRRPAAKPAIEPTSSSGATLRSEVRTAQGGTVPLSPWAASGCDLELASTRRVPRGSRPALPNDACALCWGQEQWSRCPSIEDPAWGAPLRVCCSVPCCFAIRYS